MEMIRLRRAGIFVAGDPVKGIRVGNERLDSDVSEQVDSRVSLSFWA